MRDVALPDFSRARVLIVGDVMLDRYWFGDVSRISPEAPVPVVHVQRTEERPGGAANLVVNGHKLGTAGMTKATYQASFTPKDFQGALGETPSANG